MVCNEFVFILHVSINSQFFFFRNSFRLFIEKVFFEEKEINWGSP